LIKIRNKRIALLLVLAMLATMFVSVGTASAADVTFSNSINKIVTDNSTNQILGWVKIDLNQDQYTDGSKFYVSVKLPDGVDYMVDPDAGTLANFVKGIAKDGSTVIAPTVVGTADEDELTVKVVDPANDGTDAKILDYIMVNFATANESKVKVKDGFTGNIVTDISINAVDATDLPLWAAANDFSATVGSIGSAKATFTAKTPKAIGVGSGQVTADVVITESQAAALNALGGEVYLELVDDDNYQITAAAVTAGKYSLNVQDVDKNGDGDTLDATEKGKVVAADKVTLTNFVASTPFADELKVTLTLTAFPGATGNVEIACSGNKDDIVNATVVVATLGETDVTVSANDVEAAKVYPAMGDATANDNGLLIKGIKLVGNSNFKDDKTVILTLPEGFEFDSQKAYGGFDGNGLFNNNRSLWYTVNALNDDEFTFDGLKIDAAADAPVGPISVAVTGTLTEGSVVVAECFNRAVVTADKPNVTVGLNKAVGDITIAEVKKDSLTVGDNIQIDLPDGVTFAAKPDIYVNGTEKTSDWTISNCKDQDTVTLTIASLNASKIDTIKVTGIKYSFDSLVYPGDLKVKILGNAFNKIAANKEINDTDSTDTILTVANAAVVDADAVLATSFVIGQSTYTQDGKVVNAVAASYAANNRTYLAIRDIAHVLGIVDSNILWDGANSTVTLMKGDKVVQLKVGSNVIVINGISVTMDVKVEASNNRTFLPAASVAQAFGAAATYDAATNTVTIK